ncbi:hypothetical protein HOY80DRAFT_1029123 [Tuber brumale]|nr:hypothetical protein HOY80DRAFT_1029123 [Tuber brumale]
MPATLFLYTLILAAGTALFGWNLKAIQDNLGLNAAQFGTVTKSPLFEFRLASSVLAIGGLICSILAAPGINTFGRKNMSALVFGIGRLLKASAGGAVILTIRRLLRGVASGSAAVIVPIYINELAPPALQGSILSYQPLLKTFHTQSNLYSGAMAKISITLGILSDQVMGILLVALLFLPEAPSFLIASGDIEQARRELIRIRDTQDVEDELAGYQSQPIGQREGPDNTETVDEHEPLLEPAIAQSVPTYNATPTGENDADVEAGPSPTQDSHKIGLLEFITKREYRAGFVVVAAVRLAQQLTLGLCPMSPPGLPDLYILPIKLLHRSFTMNAVVFYGVSILDGLFPDSAKYLNPAISAVNLLVSLGVSTMFDSVSHNALLLTSMGSMGVSSVVPGASISFRLATLSAIATLLFVSALSMGLGLLP